MNKKHIYIGAGVIIAGTITYIVINRIQNKKSIASINSQLDGKNPPANTSTGTGTKTTVVALPDASFPLKVGSYGKQVQKLQEALNAKYGTNLVTDGKFGDATVDALCKNFYSLCFSVTQGRLYTLSQTDYDKLVNK